ncbi:hypothetical protein [Streptomyces sp. NPDC002265]|uniref:hypothetical protein n=1 Tax=Streptomyces sp. NPDC002265 TaxID=3154415 RepID=UPI0033319E0D
MTSKTGFGVMPLEREAAKAPLPGVVRIRPAASRASAAAAVPDDSPYDCASFAWDGGRSLSRLGPC